MFVVVTVRRCIREVELRVLDAADRVLRSGPVRHETNCTDILRLWVTCSVQQCEQSAVMMLMKHMKYRVLL